MKKLFCLFYYILMASAAFAAEALVIFESRNEIIVEFRMGNYFLDSTNINGQQYTFVEIKNTQNTSKNGWPELPQFSTWVKTNDGDCQFQILEDDTLIRHYGFAKPVAETLYRNTESELQYNPRAEYYQNDAIYPSSSAEVITNAKISKANLSLVTFYPVQCNSQSCQWIFHTRIRVRLSWQNHGSLDSYSQMPRSYRDMMSRVVLNPQDEISEPDTSIKLLIVTEPQFISVLQPFLLWKRQCGIPSQTIIYSEVASNAASLKNYIRNLVVSSQTPPEYLLIVGDVDLIPCFYGVGASLTDYPYACLSEGDYLPDLSVGRLPCGTSAECTEWTESVINYERVGNTDSDFRGTVFSSNVSLDPLHGIYVTQLFTQAEMSSVIPLQQPQSGSLTELMSSLNSGNQWIFYIGHGLSQTWSSVSPHFETQHVASLSAQISPIIISVACATADLDFPQRSLAEAWMNLSDNSRALAYIGATETTPFYYSDTLGIGILRGVFHENIERMGTAVDYGRLLAAQAFPQPAGGLCEETIQQFELLGDPSMRIFSRPADNLTVIYPQSLPINAHEITVTVQQNSIAVPEALVCLSSLSNENYYSILQTNSSGQAIFQIDFAEPCQLNLAITSYNSRIYQSTINIIPNNGAFLVFGNNFLSDSLGDRDGLADRGETCAIQMSIINLGNSTSSEGFARISSNVSRISPIDETLTVNAIQPQDTFWLDQAISFTVNDSVTDMSSALIHQTIILDSNNITDYASSLLLHAPEISYLSSILIEDSGDGDGQAENGERVYLDLSFQNAGSDDARELTLQLTVHTNQITQITDSHNQSTLSPSDSTHFRFLIRISQSAERGFAMPFDYSLFGNNLPLQNGADTIRVNQVPVLLFTQDQMPEQVDRVEATMNALGVEHERVTALPQNLQRYKSIWMFSGIYPNSVPLSQNSAARLAGFLDHGGSCYWEGGDVWAFDPANALRAYFHIQGVTDGSANAGPVIGEYGTYYQNYSFSYSGENNFIDQIEPTNGANVILRNNRNNASYPLAIAYGNNLYRTIGTAIELGFLNDPNNPSSRARLFADLLNWLGITVSTDTHAPSISHTPVTVYYRANSPINIIADIQDQSGLQSVDLVFRLNEGISQTVAMQFENGLYHGQISGAPFRALVSYHINATDNSIFQNQSQTDEYLFQIESRELSPCDIDFPNITSIFPQIDFGENTAWSLTNYPENTPVLELHTENNQPSFFTTKPFDCSNLQEIELSFWNFLRTESNERGLIAEVSGSIDGGLSFPYPVWSRTQTLGGILEEGDIVINHLNWMSNQDSVVLKFSFSGNCYWRLRDVKVRANAIGEPVKNLVIKYEHEAITLNWMSIDTALYFVISSSNSSSEDAIYSPIGTTRQNYFIDSASILENMRFYKVHAVYQEAVSSNKLTNNSSKIPVSSASMRQADIRWSEKLTNPSSK